MGGRKLRITMSGSFKDGEAYWKNHYSGDSTEFDWYQQYSHLEVMLREIDDGATVLITGAGTSKIGWELANRGVATVHHIEWSEQAVQKMKSTYQNQGAGTRCRWDCEDVTKMPYANDTYDYVFDKAVLDAILCQEGGTRKSQKYLEQVARVLKPHGTFICISTGKQEVRRSYFESSFQDVQCEYINKPSTAPTENDGGAKHFIYLCKGPM